MNNQNKSIDVFIRSLEERAKELNCLYKIEEILLRNDLTLDDALYGIVKILPSGWQYSDYCNARIKFDNSVYISRSFVETPWSINSPIKVQDEFVGLIEVFYTIELPPADEGPFLKEERKLLNTIADRIGHFIFHKRISQVFAEWQNKKDDQKEKPKPEWNVVLDLLKRTDQHLFSIISRKMINHLFCKGIQESKGLFKKLGTIDEERSSTSESNRPTKKQVLENSFNLGNQIFRIASKYLSNREILALIQKWINEEKTHFLVKTLANQSTPLAEVAEAIRKYHHINPNSYDRNSPVNKGIRVSLIRRFLNDNLDFINIAKQYVDISDFYNLLNKIIFPPDSHGKVGGKSSGLFLAKKIISQSAVNYEILQDVKIPKTWYLTSDAIMNFVYYNNLEEIIEQKYKDIEDIRNEYPYMIQAFKNSHFSPEITNGLSRALDDFGEHPIIVRSSSLLEDRMGSAFAGKYKSLFLANQGTKQERLEALMDAIAEVYASTFGPDPIGYRIERGLLDFNEEMGIMIQEVVGTKVGKYFFPAFAGVAFSNNEFRWSSRIKREDGLIRMVPGLGTRAVDRLGDDYPILVAPGQPNLRVNLSYDEIIGYAPKNIDVINLEKNTFETLSIKQLINDVGNDFPMLNEIFSIHEHNHLKKPIGLGIDTRKHDIVVTFDNLIANKKYINKIHTMLKLLSEKLKLPVDIEFACDGKNLYLLQCRPQSSSGDNVSAVLPRDISRSKLLFTANKYISNGKVPDIKYIVYVDPINYGKHSKLEDLKDVGIAIGKLNKLLPKKTFILMGPGRWGSRDDIRLGVKVTYSDINNTAVLIEIAKKKGNYVPDLSFGTHFFQDLVESSIRYIPLYPDDPDIFFNEKFLLDSPNTLERYIPNYKHLEDTIRVVNVMEATGGQVVRILMNADEDQAMAIFTDPSSKSSYDEVSSFKSEGFSNEPLLWRLRMADSIAANLDPLRFGVKAVYLHGTVFNKTAGPNSDIDLLIHFKGTPEQKKELQLWLEGWNLCLSQINYNKSGFTISKFLDYIIVTDDILKKNTYFSDLINPKNNTSVPLKLKGQE